MIIRVNPGKIGSPNDPNNAGNARDLLELNTTYNWRWQFMIRTKTQCFLYLVLLFVVPFAVAAQPQNEPANVKRELYGA
ncbi:MAG TPA: hypothetical protein VIR01_15695, partial [Pyrinomonadaceae bacterium]